MAELSTVEAAPRAGLGIAAAALRAELVADRRHLHRHPELGFAETGTARFVAERLRALGATVRTGIAGTGVVGLLHGQGPGKTVMLRADMDALPIQEQNRTAYTSTVPGVMHACGHDGHVAILLGAARLLADQRDRWPGTVKLVFQPCEEGSAQGGGAHAMV